MTLTHASGVSNGPNGSILGDALNRSRAWFARFIRVASDLDLDLLALWAVHTHLCDVTYSTPRLQIDSTMPGSGKTTVLEHLQRLSYSPVQAASLSSPALLARMIDKGIRTILIDEADRTLDPKKPGVEELIAILNSGYKRGASRPVLVPAQGGAWDVKEMPTYSPVALAGNAPALPDDTRSRCIRVLLMPDLQGLAEDSDWEFIEPDAMDLAENIAQAADAERDTVRMSRPVLPEGCVGRLKEKWNPLRRVAEAAGGEWPAIADELIRRDIQEVQMEREEGLAKLPPAVILLRDIHALWGNAKFKASNDLAAELAYHDPEMWGSESPFGKPLTTQRMGRMLVQAFKIHSGQRPDGDRARGYSRAAFEKAWERFAMTPQKQTVQTVRDVQSVPCLSCGDPLEDHETEYHRECA